ncbi:MAG: ABC transporter ATP-binding protein [Acidimicrobiales bacterium]
MPGLSDLVRRVGVRERLVDGRHQVLSSLSVRARVARLVYAASPALAAAILLFVLVEGVLPTLALVAIGWATGHIPAAVRDGLGSPAGHALVVSLALGAGAYALSLMRSPLEDLLSAHSSAVMTSDLQRRLARAVSEPTGVEHLEDPQVLDRLTSATGELSSARPGDAPMTLAGVLGDRFSGLLACAVLASFRWWVGLMLLAGWCAVRPPLRRLLANRATLVRRATPALRHSWYYLGCAWRPEFAKEMRVFGLGPWVLDRHRQKWLEGMAPSWAEARHFERRALLLSAVVCAMYLIGAGELGWAAYHGEVGLRTVTVMLPMFMLAAQVGGVSADDVSLEQMLAAVPDVEGIVSSLVRTGPDAGPVAGSVVGPVQPAEGRPRSVVCFEAVEYRYPGSATPALSGLDLSLQAGSSLAIVGVNGAGKTTLVTLLARLRDPTAGRITIDGEPLADLEPRCWQRQVAVVYQDFTRYPLSLRDNVALRDLGAETDEAALRRSVEMAGATALVEGLPHGWGTVLSSGYRNGTDLSGGQWQRVALARALYSVARGATLLVLDEPTAQLDIRAEAAFYDRFLELTAGVTTLVISHRFSTVRRAERIAVLDQGRITEIGSHDELLAGGGTYAAMFEAQAAHFTGPQRQDADSG